MKEPKKIFTRMCLNNWGGISHKVMEFNEYVNLFSGMSGSGKSTVMDAIQVILYGSLSSNFLNKAADDAKNKRSVISYLRGEQKDGTANRDNVDFFSSTVLEIEDTGTHTFTCVGAWFEVHKGDSELKKYYYFSHGGRMPEGGYINSDGIPYSSKEIRALVEERRGSTCGNGRGEVNKIYPSNEAYLINLNDVILGYIDGKRFATMQKSAIALKMTNGTGQFIRDYMFPKSEGDVIKKLSEQLGAYADIKEKIDDIKKRIDLLTVVKDSGIRLNAAKADLELISAKQKCIDILDAKAKIEAWEYDCREVTKEIEQLQDRKKELTDKRDITDNQLVEIKSGIKSGDLGNLTTRLADMNEKISLLENNQGIWSSIKDSLNRYLTDEVAGDYISDSLLDMIGSFIKGNFNEKDCTKIKEKIKEEKAEIEQLWSQTRDEKNKVADELTDKKQLLEDMNNNQKSYSDNIRQARMMLEQKLTALYGKKVKVDVFADLFDITDEKWAQAVEGRLGSLKLSLVTDPEYADNAAKSFNKMKQFENIHLINSAAIAKSDNSVMDNSLYEVVATKYDYVDACLKKYLGRIIKCEDVEELLKVKDGVTPDCYSYSNFIFRHLRKKDYTTGACIGSTVSKSRLNEYVKDIQKLENRLGRLVSTVEGLHGVMEFESLGSYPDEYLISLAKSEKELEKLIKEKEKTKELIDNLKGNEYAAMETELKKLEEEKKAINEQLSKNEALIIEKSRLHANITTKIADKKAVCDDLMMGYTANEQVEEEVRNNIKSQGVSSYKNRLVTDRVTLIQSIDDFDAQLNKSRNDYIIAYPTCGFTGAEKTNAVYIEKLNEYMKNYEPDYQAEFDKQCITVYKTLRENIIAKIHNDIKAAMRHQNEINSLLRETTFSDSTYQIKIEAAKDENGQFYKMLMAPELDTKNVGLDDFEGQMSLGDDLFYSKYENVIAKLTEKFMPDKSADEEGIAKHYKEMEKYADYRTYLHFNMFEQVCDEDGNVIRENYVDEMAGRDSGGEGQNPKYVALLAGFAMLYMDQLKKESKIKLVLLDEAFSKMDQKRSEVCLRYARKLGLQMIVCVPDERLASLIRNVDCVYGFRRHKNTISMMHIDKGAYLEMLDS